MDLTYLDGPKFVTWLRDRGALTAGNLTQQVGRRWECQVRRWAKGRAISLRIADEFLTDLGVALGEVPMEIYREAPKRHVNPITDIELGRIHDLREHGLSIGEIARRIGRDHNTVRNHLPSEVVG